MQEWVELMYSNNSILSQPPTTQLQQQLVTAFQHSISPPMIAPYKPTVEWYKEPTNSHDDFRALVTVKEECRQLRKQYEDKYNELTGISKRDESHFKATIKDFREIIDAQAGEIIELKKENNLLAEFPWNRDCISVDREYWENQIAVHNASIALIWILVLLIPLTALIMYLMK